MINSVLIASGPTIEPIDPVMFISNHSSGKTGYYIAEEAKKRDVERIIYITGPSNYIPDNVDVIKVKTAIEMREQVLKNYNDVDLVIMAAVVSDYASAKIYPEKIDKDQESITLKFIKNPDILSELGNKKKKQILIGFSVETENVFENGQKKLKKNNLDLLVLTEISESNKAFDVDDNQVYFLTGNGIKANKKMKKSDIAIILWDEILNLNLNK
ncbi:MAG: phosphopantothenoylcysteine decarboxylase [Candidatus Aminicenantes bacterium]|nr:phosphopantothenoylcysteine decarboxylase [Candidatus Aminicenantes bacterium]